MPEVFRRLEYKAEIRNTDHIYSELQDKYV